MTMAYDVATFVVTAMMAGNELAVAAFVHPQLSRLPDAVHARAAASLAKVLGAVMPFWYALGLLLMAGAAWEHRPMTQGAGFLILIAIVIWAFSIAGTILWLVPINNRIGRINPEQPYKGWIADRRRWDALHRMRVGLLMAAVVLLGAGLFKAA